VAADEDAAIELWQRSWQETYPQIDFAGRVDWWRDRWRKELVPSARVVVAEMDGVLEGFVTVDPKTGYLDQIVVAPEFWGSNVAMMLLDEAKRIAPAGIELLVNKDNGRAIAFYEKNSFTLAGDDVNPVSGRPVYRMRWRQ
jgi:putative acetyltransferase